MPVPSIEGNFPTPNRALPTPSNALHCCHKRRYTFGGQRRGGIWCWSCGADQKRCSRGSWVSGSLRRPTAVCALGSLSAATMAPGTCHVTTCPLGLNDLKAGVDLGVELHEVGREPTDAFYDPATLAEYSDRQPVRSSLRAALTSLLALFTGRSLPPARTVKDGRSDARSGGRRALWVLAFACIVCLFVCPEVFNGANCEDAGGTFHGQFLSEIAAQSAIGGGILCSGLTALCGPSSSPPVLVTVDEVTRRRPWIRTAPLPHPTGFHPSAHVSELASPYPLPSTRVHTSQSLQALIHCLPPKCTRLRACKPLSVLAGHLTASLATGYLLRTARACSVRRRHRDKSRRHSALRRRAHRRIAVRAVCARFGGRCTWRECGPQHRKGGALPAGRRCHRPTLPGARAVPGSRSGTHA